MPKFIALHLFTVKKIASASMHCAIVPTLQNFLPNNYPDIESGGFLAAYLTVPGCTPAIIMTP